MKINFILPFKRRPVLIGHGFGEGSHKRWEEDLEDTTYSIDFLVPEKTKVISSSDGVVTKVKQNGHRNYSGKDLKKGEVAYKNWMNEIEIINNDGSFVSYSHLFPNGVFVKVGDKIKQGQLIGLSGNTGWSSEPHLDFCVFKKLKKWKVKTIKIKFKDYKHNLERNIK
jgi:murein DD-endopeptidase MepM/ murein hydrolase activator NlpD